MQVKHVDKETPVVIAWCPIKRHSNYLACGTLPPGGLTDETTVPHLEIMDISLSTPGVEIPKARGSCAARGSFECIDWSSHCGSESNRLGLLASAMQDGSVNLWNPFGIINQDRTSSLLQILAQPNSGYVRSLKFNPLKPNLLATGGGDGSLVMFDLNDPTKPARYSMPQKQTNISTHGKYPDSIESIAWNKVPGILAVGDSVGDTHIFDFKQEQRVLALRTRNRVPAASIAWNPSYGLHIAVAYTHGAAELWDVRKPRQPLAHLDGAHKSILDMAWCPHDSKILLTSGEEGTGVLWNDRGEKWSSINFGVPNFQVEWSVRAGMLGCASQFGKVSLWNIHHAGAHCPSWNLRPSGVHFGFGNKIASFTKETVMKSVVDSKGSKKEVARTLPPRVHVDQAPLDSTVINAARDFQNVLSSLSEPERNLSAFAQSKMQECRELNDPEEEEIWKLIGLFYEYDVKNSILKYLGYEVREDVVPGNSNTQVNEKDNMMDDMDLGEDDISFFENVPTMGNDGGTNQATEEKGNGFPSTNRGGRFEFEDESKVDADIKNALIAGDYATAVRISIGAGNIADALVFGHQGGPELFAKARKAYFESHRQRFISQMFSKAVVEDFETMVDESDCTKWQETLGLLSTQTDGDVFVSCVTRLGDRLLEEEGNIHGAIVCYLTGCQIGKLTQIWKGQLDKCIEKLLVVISSPNVPSDESLLQALGDTFGKYALQLSEQGCLDIAANFLRIARDYNVTSTAMNDLLFRISQAQPNLNITGVSVPWARQRVRSTGRPYAQRQSHDRRGRENVGNRPVQQAEKPRQQTISPGPKRILGRKRAHPRRFQRSNVPPKQPIPPRARTPIETPPRPLSAEPKPAPNSAPVGRATRQPPRRMMRPGGRGRGNPRGPGRRGNMPPRRMPARRPEPVSPVEREVPARAPGPVRGQMPPPVSNAGGPPPARARPPGPQRPGRPRPRNLESSPARRPVRGMPRRGSPGRPSPARPSPGRSMPSRTKVDSGFFGQNSIKPHHRRQR